jgi:hypothetical protein
MTLLHAGHAPQARGFGGAKVPEEVPIEEPDGRRFAEKNLRESLRTSFIASVR